MEVDNVVVVPDWQEDDDDIVVVKQATCLGKVILSLESSSPPFNVDVIIVAGVFRSRGITLA